MEDESKTPEAPEVEETASPEAALQRLEERCAYFEGVIQQQINVKDGQIDRLHQELEGYRRDAAARQIREVMKQVIRSRAKMKMQLQSSGWESLSADALRQEYTCALDDLTDLLERQEIDPFETEPGQPFDASRHQISQIELTEDPALDKTVKESKKEGFVQRETILVPERVVVYQYKKGE